MQLSDFCAFLPYLINPSISRIRRGPLQLGVNSGPLPYFLEFPSESCSGPLFKTMILPVVE